jgi:hypothetical protein
MAIGQKPDDHEINRPPLANNNAAHLITQP